jgi:hypothetical protein
MASSRGQEEANRFSSLAPDQTAKRSGAQMISRWAIRDNKIF